MEVKDRNFDINNIILPAVYSKRVQDAINDGKIGKPENRLLFIRESVAYFESSLDRPTAQEYAAISKQFCDHYPVLRNSQHTDYWVKCVIHTVY